MRAIRPLVLALFAGAVVLVAACGDRTPTGAVPRAPAPDASLIGDLGGALGLLKCSQLPYDSVTKTIGYWGGSLQVGPHTLTIPVGALPQSTTITAVIPQGKGVNAVKFRPEGLQFQRPAYLTMSYGNCSLLGLLLPKHIAYTTDALQILEYLLSLDDIFTKHVTGQVRHFSDYVVAW